MNTRVSEGRTALAVTVLLIATLTVPTLLWGNATSSAQQGQPSPSGTAPSIQLLNPSDYSTFSHPSRDPVAGPQISDKDTSDADSDPEYHFTAVIANAPQQPYVEFWLIQGSTEYNLGCAGTSFQGGTCQGTFGPNGAVGLVRDIPDEFAEGPGPTSAPMNVPGRAVVRAILFRDNGQTEVARDDQPVVINQAGEGGTLGADDPEKAAETVEILYPTHGGNFGLFRPASGGAIGVIDVEWSDGTDAVRVFYTVSPPDVDPAWETCGTESTAAATDATSAQDGVRCTLEDGHVPENVTGVAAVARDNETWPGGTPGAPQDNSGDAHRVVGYSQVPGVVIVTNQTLPASRVNDCSDLLVAQVRDTSQEARPIAGVDVDVHAQGPTDNLAFNTHAGEQDQFEQNDPDRSQAPQNHPTETGRRCSDDSRSGTQGVHAVGGGDDRKHIESVDDTDDDGQFVYKLWSDAQGGTRMTAWADTTDDDRFCGDERAGNGTVVWGSAANDPAPPAEGPEPPPCPNPSPTPSPSGSSSPSGSPSATASPTPTPSPSPSQSGSPTPTPSPTPSQSATATPTPTPSQTGTATPPPTPTPGGTETASPPPTGGPGDREVTIEPSKPRKTFRRPFTLSGTVTSENPACTSGVTVNILRDVIGGNSEFEQVAVEQTGADGAFSVNMEADRSANYVAQVESTLRCSDALSTPAPVLVRVKVFLKVSDGKVRRGERVRLKLRTAPCPETARDKVLLFRAIEGKYGKTGKKRSDGQCKAAFSRRVWKHAIFQGRWPKQTPEFIIGKTRPKAVRVVRS